MTQIVVLELVGKAIRGKKIFNQFEHWMAINSMKQKLPNPLDKDMHHASSIMLQKS